MGSDNIEIISANVRGLRQQFKRMDLFNYFKKFKADIVCLQETHLIQKDHNTIRKEWNIEYFIAGNSTNSRGVAILIDNTFEYTISSCLKDPEGRYIVLEISVANLFTFFIINIYGPNRDEPGWYQTLFDKIEKISNGTEIWTGDWNAALSINDTYNYLQLRNHLSSSTINKHIERSGLIDIWRTQFPERKRFTWRSEKPCKASRLDYFLISEDILSSDPKADILNAYKSDHNIIKLSFCKSSQKRGKGIWKFNNALLENKDFIEMIKAEILLAEETYALPVYDPTFVARDKGETLEISISSTLFLETLLCQMRGQIIKFSKTIKKIETEMEEILTNSIKHLQEEIDSDPIKNSNKKDSLRELSLQLENLRENKIKGSIIRSRATLVDNWEKPSKYFLSLEKRNHVNKNIPSLKDEKEKTVTDSREILKLQQKFYQDLFSSKETIPLKESKFFDKLHSLPKISDSNKEQMDAPYTIEELLQAIKNSKLNKAPGPDGYSNEFFKFFIEELKFWIFRYINEAILNQSFSKCALEGVITCIPKQGKLRNDLKNWRPLTLLNCIYNFFSSMVSNRLKACLPSIISGDQTGFISGRFIGENTRMVYDTLEYCESHQKKGLLMILDFSKAFDTIEWPFISTVLNIFNFGETFASTIKLCQTNSTSKVVQNGFLSSTIELHRGCRQGDPLSPYVFVLCAEILSHVIRESGDVRGIDVHGEEFKVSQYADDTTLLLDEDQQSIVSVIRILKWFKTVSGLDINKEKTKMVKLGASRDSSIIWQGKFGFQWADNFEILGIHYNMEKLNSITDLNINRKMGEIKKLIRIWSSRNLTPYGKVTIIKSLLVSKITHMLLSLPSPSPETIREINETFSSFLWCGKPPKWRKGILEGEFHEGGLKLHNIQLFDKMLKLSWLKRYLCSSGKWTIFPNDFELHGVFQFGPDYLERTIEMTSNPFWKDVIQSLQIFWNSEAPLHKNFIKFTPIWFNPVFSIPIKKEWLKKGISTVADFLGIMNVPLSMEEFKQKFNVKTIFLEYHAIIKKIKKHIEWRELPLHQEEHPWNSALNVMLNITAKGCSKLYNIVKGSNSHILETASCTWLNKGNLNLESFYLSTSFKYHHLKYQDTYLKYIQFRTLHHRFFTNNLLFKIGIKNSNLCGFCQETEDSNSHMLLTCIKTEELWCKVESWIRELGMEQYNLTQEKRILGDMENSTCINTIILITKKVIYNSMKKEQKPCIFQIKNDVKNFYFLEKYRHYIKGKKRLFDKQYALLTNIYN